MTGFASTSAPAEARPGSVPAVVAGQRVSAPRESVLTVRAPSGVEVSFPAFDGDLLHQLVSQDRHLLVDVPLQEILSFLNRVGKNWKSDEYSRRRIYIRQLQDLLGYSEPA